MPTLIAGAVAVLVLYFLLQMFRAANPAVLARALKIVGGVVALAVAAFVGARGELAVAIPIGVFGAGLLGWSPFGSSGVGNFGGIFGAGAKRSAGQRSQVRSQFLHMTLDHDSGLLEGQIIAGPYAGRAARWPYREPVAMSWPAHAACVSWRALATGPIRVWLNVPSHRGAFASSVANSKCTTITAPTIA